MIVSLFAQSSHKFYLHNQISVFASNCSFRKCYTTENNENIEELEIDINREKESKREREREK